MDRHGNRGTARPLRGGHRAVDVIDVPGGHHAFETANDTDAARDAVRRSIAWWAKTCAEPAAPTSDRNHAKFLAIDHRFIIVTSANFSWCCQTFRMSMAASLKMSTGNRAFRAFGGLAAVLGRLIIAYIVMRRLGHDRINDIASDWDTRLADAQGHTHVALRDLAASIDGKPSRRSASTPSRGFKRVTDSLQDDKWLTKEIERILAPGGSASPSRTVPWAPWPSAPEFRLPIGTVHVARGLRCNDGFLVSADSMAGFNDWPSLSTTQLSLRRNLRDSLGLVPSDGYLRLTRDALFESPSQAAAVMIGHSTNGPDLWTGPDGRSYNLWFPKP